MRVCLFGVWRYISTIEKTTTNKCIESHQHCDKNSDAFLSLNLTSFYLIHNKTTQLIVRSKAKVSLCVYSMYIYIYMCVFWIDIHRTRLMNILTLNPTQQCYRHFCFCCATPASGLLQQNKWRKHTIVLILNLLFAVCCCCVCECFFVVCMCHCCLFCILFSSNSSKSFT